MNQHRSECSSSRVLSDLFTLRTGNVLVASACLPFWAITFNQYSWELDFDHANTSLHLGHTCKSE